MAMVVNLQRKVKLKAADFMPFVIAVRAALEETDGGHFSVAFVSDKRMRDLNKMFRAKDSTTDVLSFPHEPDEFESESDKLQFVESESDLSLLNKSFLGDIVISVEQAERQARENGLELDAEIKQLILHGVLHLCGYDHETDSGEMNQRELTLRTQLNI